MNNEKKCILIIDDSPNDIQILMENLKDKYAILVATNGEKGINIANGPTKPDVILIDVVMPEMDGYTVCKKLKDNPETCDINVIFVSAHDTTEEKLAGYEVGGSDYVIKPVDPKELQSKVRIAIENKHLKESITIEKDFAFNTAMTAMTSAGEQGVVLEFLRHSFTVQTVENLAKMIVESTEKYNLKTTVQLNSVEGVINFGSTIPVPPLEQDLLTQLRKGNRIQEYDNRAIFNFGAISLLIKNMPEDDDQRGRLRDHLAILLEGAETKFASLEMQGQLSRLVHDARLALRRIDEEQVAHKKASQEYMDNLMLNLESSFIPWGLTEEQETILLTLVNKATNASLDHLEKGMKIDEKMRDIINRLVSF